jgi:5'-3' exonuclease
LGYELGQPFLPFQQLLAVLPPSCKKILPVPYHGLMSNENSPLSDFYPSVTSFEVNISSRNAQMVIFFY